MIDIVISAFIMVFVAFYIWNKWSTKPFRYNCFKTIVAFLFTTIFTIVNYILFGPLIRLINMVLFFVISYKILYSSSLSKSIVSPFLLELIYVISESIFSIIMLSILHEDAAKYASDFSGAFISNISISLLVLIISNFKVIKNLNKYLNNKISNYDNIKVIFFSCIILLIYSIYAVNTYYKIQSNILLFLSLFIMIAVIVLMFIFIKTKDDYYKINDRYNSSLLSLKELENVLTNQRIDNHENKNQLMTIRNMTKNKKVTNFIDSILNNTIPDDKRIMQETSIIPSGGLRGLVYSKLLLMNKNNIEYELDIASSIRIVDMIDYGDDTMIDICKILGIFLDNAIEEVLNIEDKFIVVEMYIEEDILFISITNTFDNSNDKNDIYKPGVSTKGNGHGYGLSLVKKIVKNNDKLETYHEITENEFSQTLKVYK